MKIDALSVSAPQNALQPNSALVAPTGGAEFSTLLNGAVGQAHQALRSAEVASIEAIHGSGSVTDIAHKVLAAERTLQTVISVRDKAVSAFHEITRMQI
jgi:flagellar hook-basal body complex protein FliE